MNDAAYIIHYTEAVNPVESKKMYYAKRVYVVLWIGIIVGSILFRKNLFMELNFISKVLLILIGLSIIFSDTKKKRVPAKLEICFEKDYMSLFREKYNYNRKYARQEYEEFNYKDIQSCVYDQKNQKITIKGKFHSVAYKYCKDGRLEDKPCYDRIETGFRYFYTNLDQTDIVQEINCHTPIQVNIVN